MAYDALTKPFILFFSSYLFRSAVYLASHTSFSFSAESDLYVPRMKVDRRLADSKAASKMSSFEFSGWMIYYY